MEVPPLISITPAVVVDTKNEIPAQQRNILTLLSQGSKLRTGTRASWKLQRIANGFRWRQCFEGCSEYILPLAVSSTPLVVTQIPNGEVKDLGTGTFVWPAAAVMSKYLERHADLVRGKSVIELGSGTGLCGLMSSFLGPSEVCLTDQIQVLDLLRENVSRAIADHPEDRLSSIRVEEYSWGGSHLHLNGPFDLVLVSDCVLPKLYPMPLLVEAVNAVLGFREDCVALFSFEQRVFPLFDVPTEFDNILGKFDMKREKIDISKHDSIYCSDELEMWVIRRIGEEEQL